MSFVIGIDLGGTKVAAAAVEGTGLSHAVEHPTDLTSAEALLDGIEAVAREVWAGAGAPEAVGIGAPSQIEFDTGTVLASVNIPLEGVPLRSELGRRLGVPVFVDNDANCAALAEAQLVPDPPAEHLVMLTLGTGVGGGVVIDGMIERGHSGLGAELGHVIIDGPLALDSSAPGFPRPGSLEWHCSGTGLELAATEVARALPAGALGGVLAEKGKVSARDVDAAARAGDEEALGLFSRLGRWLGLGIATMVNTFEPQYVLIGGGLSRAADLFLETARGEAARNALPELWKRVSLGLARGGADAGVIGAGLLAAREEGRSRNTAGTKGDQGVR